MLVSSKEHHRCVDLPQEVGQVLTDARRVQQDGAGGTGTFSQGNSYRGTAKGVSDENDPGGVDAAIDDFRRPVDDVDYLREGSPIADPWAVIGKLQRQAVHAPGSHMHGLIAVRFFRAVISMQ